ncbi:CGNR zinc finger domain-containing protein [Actinoplanes sp. NPDC051851]|uniref:CGNR zinc finger domain-containing protein n=1 Tax=Actinoplanes sp. NPDC051851 TaxID=3154753 RepID=UPI003417B90A
MIFAPDTEGALAFVVTLVNTAPEASRSGDDELATVAQLRELLSHDAWSGRFDFDDQELSGVRETRTLLRELWSLGRDDAVEVVNRMLREAQAVPYLARHDDLDWHIHAVSPDAPLGIRMRVEAAMALIDVIRMNATTRLRVCAADHCDAILADLSRNGSKRFCSTRCGNRTNMASFRSRRVLGRDMNKN